MVAPPGHRAAVKVSVLAELFYESADATHQVRTASVYAVTSLRSMTTPVHHRDRVGWELQFHPVQHVILPEALDRTRAVFQAQVRRKQSCLEVPDYVEISIQGLS